LAAISNSPINPYSVFAEIAASAVRLCDADEAGIFQIAGDRLRSIGTYDGSLTPMGQGALPLTRGFFHVP
jgi:hypothetical protein